MNFYLQKRAKGPVCCKGDAREVEGTQGEFAGTVGTIKRIKKTQCVVVQLEGFAALALAFGPPSWLEELTEEAYREAMQMDGR